MSHAIELSRRKHLPAGRIEILFIAEALPADSGRFFYFDQVGTWPTTTSMEDTHNLRSSDRGECLAY